MWHLLPLFCIYAYNTLWLIIGIWVVIRRRLNLPAENYFLFHGTSRYSIFVIPLFFACFTRAESKSKGDNKPNSEKWMRFCAFHTRKGRKLHERFPLNYNIALNFLASSSSRSAFNRRRALTIKKYFDIIIYGHFFPLIPNARAKKRGIIYVCKTKRERHLQIMSINLKSNGLSTWNVPKKRFVDIVRETGFGSC